MLRALATSHALSVGTAYFLVAAAAAVIVLLIWNADATNKELARLGAWYSDLADDHRDLCTRVNELDAQAFHLQRSLDASAESGRRVGGDLHEAATNIGDAAQSLRATAGSLRVAAIRFQGRPADDGDDDGQDEYVRGDL